MVNDRRKSARISVPFSSLYSTEMERVHYTLSEFALISFPLCIAVPTGMVPEVKIPSTQRRRDAKAQRRKAFSFIMGVHAHEQLLCSK
jgi:hypothetical protein